MTLGEKIRKYRKTHNYTLEGLAREVGVTASFISQAERDMTKPSLDTLGKLARVLSIPVFELLEESSAEGKAPLVKKNERREFKLFNSLASYELLSLDLHRKMQLFIGKMEPSDLNFATPLGKDTEECIYVLKGRLKVQLDDKLYTVEPGDSIYFEGRSLRLLQSVGEEPLEFISAITPPAF